MCGITGVIDLDHDLRRSGPQLEAMTATMRLRGPDAGGTWLREHAALGHRRLAVIDIAGGAQPMCRRFVDGPPDELAIVYSGEVYNYRELRAELRAAGAVFESDSDTEVVLRAYEAWGDDVAGRLNGMFAFAIWDGRRQRAVLVRDRLGVKPLYYCRGAGGALVFGSEPKALVASGDYRPRTSEADLNILLNARLTMAGETPFTGMHQVKPGHVLTFSRDGLTEHEYWRLESREHTDDLDTTVVHVRDLLDDIVARQVVADVPVSFMLSGGLDSTTVAALAAAGADDPIGTYCVSFRTDADDFTPTQLRPEVDAPYARRAAAYLGAAHHDVVLDTADLAAALPAARAARDLPSLGQFDTSMYLLFGQMATTSTVGLSAEAADEVFGGYPWYHDDAVVWGDTFPWLGSAPRLASCLTDDVRARIRPREFERDRYAQLRSHVDPVPGESSLDARMREVLYFSLLGPLCYLLDRKDRMSMALGFEVRVPFCDHRLVEYVWNTPWAMKIADGEWKSLLRLAARDVVPAETLARRKSGYPGTHDPVYEALVMAELKGVLDSPDSPLAPVLDRDRIWSMVAETTTTMTWLSPSHFLLPLIEIDSWMRSFDLSF